MIATSTSNIVQIQINNDDVALKRVYMTLHKILFLTITLELVGILGIILIVLFDTKTLISNGWKL